MIIRLLLITALMAILSACSSTEVMKPTTKVGASNGVIVASVTKSGLSSDAWFYYKKKGTNDELRMDAVGLTLYKSTGDFPNDKNKVGRLLAFEAPAGNYDLTRWEIYIYTTGPGYIRPRKIEPLPFSVKAGRVTYLGNLHIDTLSGKNIFGISIPAAGKATITNQKNRDFVILKKKYPNLGQMPINVSIPNVKNWGLK